MDHLSNVAEKAATFACAFDAGQQARVAGLLHDLGKVHQKFQDRIRAAANSEEAADAEKPPHCHHGAAVALKENNYAVAFAVNGHHAGLHNRGDLQDLGGNKSVAHYESEAESFCRKLRQEQPDFAAGLDTMLKQLFPPWVSPEKLTYNTLQTSEGWRAYEFFTRFLFSALVDADRVATEEKGVSANAQANALKRTQWREFDPFVLLQMLNADLGRRAANARLTSSEEVNEVRQQVRAYCSGEKGDAVTADRGLFSLTVPTGGGKTLASLLFALSHAKHHNEQSAEGEKHFRRVIIVIPYLNIIQQTAFELRKLFGDLIWKKDAVDSLTGNKTKHPDTGEEGAWLENDDPNHRRLVLEHHSNASDPPQSDTKKKSKKDHGDDAESGYSVARTLRQLAAENWDAPIIVTTSVQFFDSLFSRRPADCRKLHNIAQSVIVFDEVQTLPPHLLLPILDALRELTHKKRPYGCSAVLCTATQPALRKHEEDFPEGLESVHPIIPDEKAKEHFKKLEHVQYTWPNSEQKEISLDDLHKDFLAATQRDGQRRQGLIIFNTRRDCRDFFEKLGGLNNAENRRHIFHLSTWMYPAHRLAVLEEVRRRLAEKEDCLLVSTQCVEAGVDVDFPVVWRQFGPYDAIVQAAGRCNRNGALKDNAGRPARGKVRVFHLVDEKGNERIPGGYGPAIATTELLRKLDQAHPTEPNSFQHYFRLLYQVTVPDADKCPIQKARGLLRFKEVSENFHLIESATLPVLVTKWRIGGSDVDIPVKAAFPDVGTLDSFVKHARAKGFFNRDEWRLLSRFIVGLSFPLGRSAAPFRNKQVAELVFSDDDPIFGLHRLTASLYEGGLNGAGLDTTGSLGDFDYCL